MNRYMQKQHVSIFGPNRVIPENYSTNVSSPGHVRFLLNERLTCVHFNANKFYTKLRSESEVKPGDADNILAIFFDFMNNMQLPKTPVGDVFYFQQLTVSVFCIHNIKENKAKMYIYHEGQAKKAANEICSSRLHKGYFKGYPATMLLLKLRAELDPKFGDKKTSKAKLWSEIASKLNDKGYNLGENGTERCRQKFSNLSKAYYAYVRHQTETGTGEEDGHGPPPYFEMIHSILGRTMDMANDSNSDSSNASSFGCLIFIRKRDGFSVPYELVPGQITIGSADDADVRIKIPDERLQETHCLIEIDENGIATLVNKAGDDTVRVNNKPVRKFKILEHDDMIDVIGKKFQYANENLLNNEVQTEKPVPASLSSRNRETINIYAQKRTPTKSPTFKVKSPSYRRRSSHKISDLIILDTPDKSHNRSSVHVTPKQVIYAPIVEDVSPATPPNAKDTDVFKTPVNTPGIFEDLRKSVLQSRTRRSSKKIVSADMKKEQVINNKRDRESSLGSQRSVKRRRMMYSTDNNSEVELLEESFESFNSEDWSEISQDQTDREHRFSDLTSASFPYQLTKSMSEPRVRQLNSVRLSRHNKTISLNFHDHSEPPVQSSLILANGIREDQLVESPRPSTSNFLMASDSDSPLNHSIRNKSLLTRSPASTTIKALQKSPNSDPSNIIGSPKLKRDSYISDNLSKFVGLKQLMRNRDDLSDIFGVNACMSTPKICKSPKNDLTDVRGVKKLMSTPQPRHSPRNTLLEISGVDALFNSPKLRKSQANDTVQFLEVEKSISDSPSLTRTPKSMINYAEDVQSPKKSPRMSVSATKTPKTAMRKSMPTPKMSQTLKNEVLDLSAVKTPYNEVLETSTSKRSTKTPITVNTPNDNLSDSAVNGTVDCSSTKRLSRTPKRFDSSEYDLINLSNKSQADEYHDVGVLETSGQRRLRRSSQYDLVDTVVSKKSISSPRLNKTLQNNVLETSRSTMDHDYARRFNVSLPASQFIDSAGGKKFETTGTRRSTRTPINKQRSEEVVYGSAPKNLLSTSRQLNSSETSDLENCESRASTTSFDQYSDDDLQYVSESRKSISTSQDFDTSGIEISNTSRLRCSTRTPSTNKFVAHDDDVDDEVNVSGSRKLRSLSQKYHSPTVADLQTSRRSVRTPSATKFADDNVVNVSGSRTSQKYHSPTVVDLETSRKSIRTPSATKFADDDVVNVSGSRKSRSLSQKYHSPTVVDLETSRKSIRTPSATKFADDDVVNVSGSRTSKKYHSPTVADLETSRKSIRTPSADQYPDDDIAEIDLSKKSRSRKSLRTPSDNQNPDEEIARIDVLGTSGSNESPGMSSTYEYADDEIDVLETSPSRKSQKIQGNNQADVLEISGSKSDRTTNDIRSLDEDLTQTGGPRTKTPSGNYDAGFKKSRSITSMSRRGTSTPGGRENPEDDSMDVNYARTSMATSRRLTKTPSSSRKSITTSQMLLNEYGAWETGKFGRTTNEPSEEGSVDISCSKKSLLVSKVFDSPASDSLESGPSTRISRSESKRSTKTPSGSKRSFSSSELLNSSTRTPRGNGNVSASRRSMSASKLFDSSALNNSSPSISITETSSGNLHPEDHLMNVTGPRASTSTSKRLTKTPSTEKSLSTSKILNSTETNALVSSPSRTPKRRSSGNPRPGDDTRDYVGPRKSSISKKNSLVSGFNEHLDDDSINVSRNSISASKSKSVSRVNSPVMTSVVDKDVTLENSEPRRMTRTPRNVEGDDVMNFSSRSRRQTRTASGSLYLEDEVMNISMSKKSSSQTTATSSGNESASPKCMESSFTCEISKSPKNDLSDVSGVKRLMKTPTVVKSPRNDLSDVSGVKRLMKTPTVAKSHRNDLSDVRGVKRLMKTPTVVKSPRNDLSDVSGVKRLMKTPTVVKYPRNDLSDVSGVKRLMKTPTVVKSPRNDLSNVSGVKDLFKDDQEDLFASVFNKKPLRTYSGKFSTSRNEEQSIDEDDDVDVSRKSDLVEQWVEQQDFLVENMENIDEVVDVKKSMESTADNKTKTKKTRGSKTSEFEEVEENPVSIEKKRPKRGQKNNINENNSLIVLPEKRTRGKKKNDADEAQKIGNVDESNDKKEENEDFELAKPSSRSRGKKKNEVEENVAVAGAKPTKATRGKKKAVEESNSNDETNTVEKKSTRNVKSRSKKLEGVEETDTKISDINQKPTRKGRSRKDQTVETTKDAEKRQSKTALRNEEVNIEESNEKEEIATDSIKRVRFVQTTEVNTDTKKSDQSRRREENVQGEIDIIKETAVQRRGGNKKAVQEDSENVKESAAPAPARRGRSKKVAEADKDDSKDVKDLPAATKKGRNKKTTVTEEVSKEIKEPPIPAKRGRNKKASVADEDDLTEIKEAPAPARRGRQKKLSVAEEDDLTEAKELPAPARRGRNKKAVEANEEESIKDVNEPPKRGRNKQVLEDVKEDGVKDSPAPKRGRKKAVEDVAEVDVKDSPAPKRGRKKAIEDVAEDAIKDSPAPKKGRKKAVEDVAEDDVKDSPAPKRGRKKAVEDAAEVDVKDSPAPKKGRKKAVEDVAEEEPKRTRRARGNYDKYGGAFLSESPLNTKRLRSKK